MGGEGCSGERSDVVVFLRGGGRRGERREGGRRELARTRDERGWISERQCNE